MRQFISSSLPDKKGRITLSTKEKHYLKSVLRLKDGDKLTVRLSSGDLCVMKVVLKKDKDKAKTEVLLELVEQLINDDKIEKNNFYLFQFLPKGQKMDLIVRQATECGAVSVVPIVGDYTVGGKEDSRKLDRWNRIVREAKQQSGSATETKVLQPTKLENALEFWKEEKKRTQAESLAIVLCEKNVEEQSLFSLFKKCDLTKPICVAFAVGCEGGISDKELHSLHECGFKSIHLDTNILRAETAALYGFAAVQTALTEYKKWMELNG